MPLALEIYGFLIFQLQREGYVDVEWHRQQMRELREQIVSLIEKNSQLQETVKLGAKEQTNLGKFYL